MKAYIRTYFLLDTTFEKEWFMHKGPDTHSWNSSQSRNFLEKMASKYLLKEPNDWKKVTSAMICQNGGMGLLHYHGNLVSALQISFPNYDWQMYTNTNNLNTQSKLETALHELFPKEHIATNVRSIALYT